MFDIGATLREARERRGYSLDDVQQSLHFRERYLTRFFTALTPERMVLYGAPDAAVRSALAQLAPPVMPQVGGFTRHAPAGKTGTR